MTDLEIVKACARAMEIDVFVDVYGQLCMEKVFRHGENEIYWPLTNDAQCFALVKRFGLSWLQKDGACFVWDDPNKEYKGKSTSHDLNRAICECVAKVAK